MAALRPSFKVLSCAALGLFAACDDGSSGAADTAPQNETTVVDTVQNETTVVDTVQNETTVVDTVQNETTVVDTTTANDSTQADSTQADSTQADSTQADSTQSDSTQADSTQADSTQADSTQADSTQADSTQADTATTDATETDVAQPPTPLLLTLTLHLENSTFNAAYFTALDTFAKTFEAHGGRLTFEPRDQVVTAAAGPPQLFDWRTLEARGHAIGSHAAIGGTNTQTLASFTAQAKARYDQLAPKVDVLEHVSGNCGNVDWVTGVVSAGFQATTAATVLCMLAMAPEDRPPEYKNLVCNSPTDPVCHTSYPTALADRIHPWRAKDAAHWTSYDATGKLVIVPGSGTLPCLEEEAHATGGALPTCTLTAEDVTRALAELDQAIALADPSKVNTFYWVWGSWKITAAEQPVLEDFLDAIDTRVAAGQIQWANVHEMLDAYVAWEADQP